jgi:hypothetical protein
VLLYQLLLFAWPAKLISCHAVLLQGSNATLAVDGVTVATGRLPPRTARIAYAGMLLLY